MDAGIIEPVGKEVLCNELEERRKASITKSEDELSKQIEAAKLQRVRDCGAALEAVLQQFNCTMSTEVVIRGSQFSSQVILIAK